MPMAGSARCVACGNDVPFAAAFCRALRPARRPRLCGISSASTKASRSPARSNRRSPNPPGDRAAVPSRRWRRSARSWPRRWCCCPAVAIPATTAPPPFPRAPRPAWGRREPTSSIPTRPSPARPPRPARRRPRARPPRRRRRPRLVTFVGDVPGPVLGEETGGLSVYSFEKTVIRRVELDTGRVTTLRLAHRHRRVLHDDDARRPRRAVERPDRAHHRA